MIKAVVFSMLVTFPLMSNAQADELKTVGAVDIPQYMGTWYQVAGLPQVFDKDCVCSRQVLDLDEAAGVVNVKNTCNFKTTDGPLMTIQGTASVVDTTTNAKLEVDFGMPYKGNYWIIGLDAEYRYAVVSDPTRQSLFILSRTPELEPELYAEAFAKATEQNIDMSKVKTMEQTNCTYPQ